MQPNSNSRFFIKKRKPENELRGHRPDEAAAIEAFIATKGVKKLPPVYMAETNVMSSRHPFGSVDCLAGFTVRSAFISAQ